MLIIVDAGARNVAIADLSSDSVSTLGRVGAGPREYQYPVRVSSHCGGTGVITDIGNLKLIPVDGWGRLVAPEVSFRKGVARYFLGRRTVGGVDEDGGIYFEERGLQGASRPSTYILRYEPSTERLDSVAEVQTGTAKLAIDTSDQRTVARLESPAIADSWTPLPSGGVIVVRGADLSIDAFRRSGGRQMARMSADSGRTDLPEDAERVLAYHREARMQVYRRDPQSSPATPPPTLKNISVQRPDIARGLTIDEQGALWIHVGTRETHHGEVFRVISSAATRQVDVLLPAGSRIVGHGSRSIYVAVADAATGLEAIQAFRRDVPTKPRLKHCSKRTSAHAGGQR